MVDHSDIKQFQDHSLEHVQSQETLDRSVQLITEKDRISAVGLTAGDCRTLGTRQPAPLLCVGGYYLKLTKPEKVLNLFIHIVV